MGEVLTVFIAIVIGLKLPLIAIMILWMNLITDGFPALALGLNPPEPGVMEQPPLKKGHRILSTRSLMRTFFLGAMMALGTLFVFQLSDPEQNLAYAQTMAFTTIVTFELWQTFNYRSMDKSVFRVGLFKNMYLWYALSTSLALQLLVIYGLNDLFNTVPLVLMDWVIILSVSSSVFVVREVTKLVWKG